MSTVKPPDIASSRNPSRRDRKKARRRKEILDCAVELFVQRGYDHVTVDDIVEAVDIAKGTFFNYFPSKTDVLVEYWGNIAVEILSYGEKLQDTSGRVLFGKYFRKLARCIRRDGAMYEILVHQAFGRPSEVVPHKDWAERRTRLFRKYAKAGQACGEIPVAADIALIGEMIFDLWTGTQLEWVYRGKNFSLETKMLKKLDLFLEGLGATSSIDSPRKSS